MSEDTKTFITGAVALVAIVGIIVGALLWGSNYSANQTAKKVVACVSNGGSWDSTSTSGDKCEVKK